MRIKLKKEPKPIKISFIAALVLIGIQLSFPEKSNSQENKTNDIIKVATTETSLIRLEGSSTLQDWDAETREFHVRYLIPENWLQDKGNWNGEDVEDLEVVVPVEHLKTGTGRVTRDMRDALRFEDHPEIHFEMEELTFQNQANESNEAKTAEVKGRLTIAGVSREISISSEMLLRDDGVIEASGWVQLNMTDFDIDPPTAFLGILRADENVDLFFKVLLD